MTEPDATPEAVEAVQNAIALSLERADILDIYMDQEVLASVMAEAARAAIDAYNDAMGMEEEFETFQVQDGKDGPIYEQCESRWVSRWLPTEEKT